MNMASDARFANGGEQGDPLMPLLFSLAVHNALAEVQAELQPGEFLFAFLDDVYVLSLPERTRKIYDLMGREIAFQSWNSVARGRHARGIGQPRFLSWVQRCG